MSVDATIRHVFGHAAAPGGPPLQLADEHTLVLVTGHALRFTSTVSFTQHLLVRPRPRQLTAFDCNWRSHTIALAAREPQADIALYSFPDKKLRGRLSCHASNAGSSTFEYSHVKFSRCGRRLVSLSPHVGDQESAIKPIAVDDSPRPSSEQINPRQTLCIWDVDQLTPLAGCEGGMVTIHVAFVSFDPSNSDQLVVGGDEGLQVWKVYSLERGSNLLRAMPIKIMTSNAPSVPDEAEESRGQFVCHAWKPMGRLLVANRAGELLLVDTSTAAIEKELPLAMRSDRCVIAGIIATAETIVVLYADGSIVWLNDVGDEVLQRAMLPSVDGMPALSNDEDVESGEQLPCVITAVACAPSYSKAFVATHDGQIFEVKTSVQQDDEDDDGGVGMSDTMVSSSSESLLVTPWSKSPTGAVCASAALTPVGGTLAGGDALLATGGSSGSLSLWSLTSCRIIDVTDVATLFATSLLDKEPLGSSSITRTIVNAPPPVVITALAARPADPILVVGDHLGRLRTLCVAKVIGGDANSFSTMLDGNTSAAVELLPLHSVQLASLLAPIDILELHPTQPVLLAASTHDRVVFLLSMDHEKRFQALAILELENAGESVVDVRWSAPAHSPSSLTVTCFSSQGLFYVARYQGSSSEVSSTPVQLRGKIVAFGEEVLPYCSSLRLLASAPMSMMLAAAPTHGDLVLMKYPDIVLDPTEKISITSKVLAKDAHDGGVSAIILFPHTLSNGSELVATAGTDGVVTLWFVSYGAGGTATSNTSPSVESSSSPVRDWQLEDVQVAKKRSIVAHSGPVTSLRFLTLSNEGELALVSTGVDGHVFVLDVRLHFTSTGGSGSELVASALRTESDVESDQQLMNPLYLNVAAFAKYESVFQPEVEVERTPLLTVLQEGDAKMARERSDPRKDDVRARLRDLTGKLKFLLAENEKLPEDERLPRDEFVLNIEWKEQLLREYRIRADKVREGVERDLSRMAIVRERMKREFWDSHEEHGVQLDGLFPGHTLSSTTAAKSPLPVFNFPMRKLSRKELLRSRQIELLRLIELAHHRQEAKDASSSHHNDKYIERFAQTLPPALDWILDAGRTHPSIWAEVSSTDTSTAQAAVPAALQINLPTDLNAVTALHLVYHPAAARSSRQQRAQILLLKACVRQLASGFNAEFAAVSRLKSAKIDEVEAKNARMIEILGELSYISTLTAPNASPSAIPSDQLPLSPSWAPHEVATSILEILPDEMTQKPYETEAVRQQRSKEREEARALEAQRAQDDAAGRALRDMMNGTLEVKKEHPFAAASAALLAAGSASKEPWMVELSPEEMTPEQRQQIAQLENAQAKLREEQEKYRKGLDLELKKLRADVVDIARGFDEKLRSLHSRYFATRRKALAQHMYELRLGEHLMARECVEVEVSNAENQVNNCSRAVEEAQKDVDVFSARLEKSKDEWHRASDEDRALEKGFARDLDELLASSSSSTSLSNLASPVDHELLKHLLELFRKRKADDLSGGGAGNAAGSSRALGARGKSSQHLTAKQKLLAESNATGVSANNGPGSVAANSRVMAAANVLQSTLARTNSVREDVDTSSLNLDPFQTLNDDPILSSTMTMPSAATVVTPLDYESDRPDGVLIEDRVWRALNSLRSKKILSERAVREKADALARARATSEELQRHLTHRQAELLTAHSRLSGLRDQLVQLGSNTPLLVLVKQGQDESGGGFSVSAVTGVEDDDALLVARSKVESLNDIIRLHGQEQVGVLGKIKDFRKSINVMEWEHALLALQARDADEKYTDLQLLRVTRELQELFQHGGDSARRHAREAALLEAKLAHLGQHRARTNSKLGEKRAALMQQLRERERENRNFREQLRTLETQVQIREEICASRRRRFPDSGADGGIGDPSSSHGTKLKAIAVRRKLVDLARAQTDEIEFLRLELDKMRRRTFPSFAQHQASLGVD